MTACELQVIPLQHLELQSGVADVLPALSRSIAAEITQRRLAG